MKKFKFIHVYGTLGNLPWQSQQGRPYLGNYNLDDLKKAANGIMTVAEQRNLEILNDIFKTARRILFIGFGFDKFNLEKLNLLPWVNREKAITGTAFRLDPARKREAEIYFEEKNCEIILRDMKALDFLSYVNLS